MRTIPSEQIVEILKNLLIKINYELDQSFVGLLRKAKDNEDKSLSKAIIQDILDNQEIAKKAIFHFVKILESLSFLRRLVLTLN